MRTACIGHFDDFGIIARRLSLEAALQTCTQMDQISGFGLKFEESEFGPRLKCLGDTIGFWFEGETCEADLSLPPDRIEKSYEKWQQ